MLHVDTLQVDILQEFSPQVDILQADTLQIRMLQADTLQVRMLQDDVLQCNIQVHTYAHTFKTQPSLLACKVKDLCSAQ